MFEKNKRLRVALILTIMIAFAAGYGLRYSMEDHGNEGGQIRLGGYQFINPLLECEEVKASGAFRELRPFKDVIDQVVKEQLARKQARTIAVYFRDLENGPWFGINEKSTFTPSSMLKVPLMMAILKSAETDPAILKRTIRFDGREDLTRLQHFKPPEALRPGVSYTVEELLFRMIAYSDNNATRLLDDNTGLERVRDFMAELRIPFDVKVTEECITVRNYTSFFRILYNASYLNHEMSEKALGFLSRSSFREGIRAGLPEGMMSATKFGEFSSATNGVTEYQLNEIGIVYHPKHPYLLAIVTKGSDHALLPGVIQHISQTVFREVDRQGQ